MGVPAPALLAFIVIKTSLSEMNGDSNRFRKTFSNFFEQYLMAPVWFKLGGGRLKAYWVGGLPCTEKEADDDAPVEKATQEESTRLRLVKSAKSTPRAASSEPDEQP